MKNVRESEEKKETVCCLEKFVGKYFVYDVDKNLPLFKSKLMQK
jgi:hypothetical protein